VTNPFSFSLQFKNYPNQQLKDYHFPTGLHVIYGESGTGKSELINILANEEQAISKLFNINKLNGQNGIRVILQNPDLQIISNTIENELAFSLECASNDTELIINQLNEAKSKLLFSVNTARHPVTLSGGEKELLNISTAFTLPNSIILIDDGLSFLSNKIKRKVVEQFFLRKQDKNVIIWFTSDKSDLQFGETKWELTSKELSKIESFHMKDLQKADLKKGEMNFNIDKLNFHYTSKTPIINDFTKSVNSVRCLGIIGNNGCGKSTLASLFLKIEKPVSGSINLKYINKDNIKIGYLDQFPEKLLGVMTLIEFVQLLISKGILDRSRQRKIDDMLNVNNINWYDIKDILALDLSWTTLRLSLIIILSNCNYDLLILDEPTFGMGNQQKLNLYNLFIKYLKNKHLIIISHDHRFIGSICDSTIKL